MSTAVTVFQFLIPFLAVFLAVYAALRSIKRTGSPKKAMTKHVITLLFSFVFLFAFSMIASAATTDTGSAISAGAGNAYGMGLLGAGLAIGLCGIGAGIALAGSAPAAIGAMTEDPKTFGKSLIFVALGEAVALYGFIIAFMILNKLPASL